ncbi:MAG: hypothetical protein M1824_005707 [Vezdaea acicularis]|nr:MAG: hypothetical protein M1824_005707 [Vezdaea acicularis]
MTEMLWSPDFCLACDRQTTGGAYCSQTCRLADLERASHASEPSSPTSNVGLGLFISPSTTSSRNGFYLPPPINFAAYRSNQASRPQAPTMTSNSAQTYGMLSMNMSRSHSLTTSTSAASSKPGLTPSSSQSSLSSMGSAAAREPGYLSDQARAELREYASSFDRYRDSRRRCSWS